MQRIIKLLIGSMAAVFMAGCVSSGEYAAERRQRLLALYPLGVTTRADVTARWSGTPALPWLVTSRPAGGWAKHESGDIAQRCLASEQRTGKRVESFELRHGADGLYSLCYCWYYYDKRDRLVDVEWQWSSD